MLTDTAEREAAGIGKIWRLPNQDGASGRFRAPPGGSIKLLASAQPEQGLHSSRPVGLGGPANVG